MVIAKINQKAPLLAVSNWVQGEALNFDQLIGKVVLVEVFQVNCPGCFLYALPQAIALHQKYSDQGLAVIGVATAFEDFDKNTLENLTRLVKDAEVIGETKLALSQKGQLVDDRLPYRIPFPLAMDSLRRRQTEVTRNEVLAFIHQRLPHFEQQSEGYQERLLQQVEAYLKTLAYHAETFESFGLNGTPSHILVDKQGVLREITFGAHPQLEMRLQRYLRG